MLATFCLFTGQYYTEEYLTFTDVLYRQLLDQQSAPPTLLNSGAQSPLTKAFVQLAPFLDQTNTIIFLIRIPPVFEFPQFCPGIQKTSYNAIFNLKAWMKKFPKGTIVFYEISKKFLDFFLKLWKLRDILFLNLDHLILHLELYLSSFMMWGLPSSLSGSVLASFVWIFYTISLVARCSRYLFYSRDSN